MALSGSFSQKFNNTSLHSLVLEWTAKQNTAGNYSDVTATLFLQGNHSESTIVFSAGTDRTRYTSISINGTKSPISKPAVDIRGTEKRKLMSYTQRVNHDSEGNGSFTLSGICDINITWGGRYESSYRTSERRFSLDKIARGSNLSIATPTVNYGDKLKFTINSFNSSFRHIVKLRVAGFDGNMMENQAAGYKEFQTQKSWMSSLSSSTTTVGTITLDTYSGNSRIARDTYNVRFNVPSDVAPSFSNLAHREMNSQVSNVIGVSGKYVQGLSKIKFDISTAGGYSSDIKSTHVTVGGYKVTGDVFDLDWYKHLRGSVSYEIEVIDSRNRTSTSKGNLDVLEYNPPKISAFSSSRDSVGNVVVTRSGSVSPLYVNGVSKNTLASRIYYAPYGSSSWREYGSTSYSFNSLTLTGLDSSSSFQLKTSITDRFMTVESTATIGTKKALLNLHKEYGLGIGKMHEKGVLDVAGDAYFDGSMYGREVVLSRGVRTAEINYSSLNDIRVNLVHFFKQYDSVSDKPPISSDFFLECVQSQDGKSIMQTAYGTHPANCMVYSRTYEGGRWGKWIFMSGYKIASLGEKTTNVFSPYATSGDNNPIAVRNGAFVTLFGAFKNTRDIAQMGGEGIAITQLPFGFQPHQQYLSRNQASGAGTFLLEVNTNGILYASRYNTTHTGGYTNVGLGSWFNIHCTFLGAM